MVDSVSVISRTVAVAPQNVVAVLRLLDDGATVPFIARYRKEVTGGLDEVAVEAIRINNEKLRELSKRKKYILDVISEQGKLSEDLRQKIEGCYDSSVLEDLYLPYRPKRRTRASVAREAGLEPLAKMIMSQRRGDISAMACRFINDRVPTVDDAIAGASDIIAEWVSESDVARSAVRAAFSRGAVISSKVVAGKESEGENYRNYFNFSEPLNRCSSHRYLAMRRGEAEGVLNVKLSVDDEHVLNRLSRFFIKRDAPDCIAELIADAVTDAYKRLIRPSIETEIAAAAKLRSDNVAIDIFTQGLRQVLMAPPLRACRVMAVDPGFRTGCKIVCLDEQGCLLHHEVIYPCAPHNKTKEAADIVCTLFEKYHFTAIALGNGTASRETLQFLKTIPMIGDVAIHVVSEQGASIYSASDCARREFPDYDITVRGAVSIGRRLIDPLAELVKIDPKSIGVGQYQHDVNQSMLKQALDFTVESCVNQVGVDVNTASVELLSYVSGIGQVLAANIVKYRTENGPFGSRAELRKVPRLGDKAYQQCSGFMRVPGSANALDNSAVHPESYPVVYRMARRLGCDVESLIGNKEMISRINPGDYVDSSVGLPTLTDILEELEKPGRDPRLNVGDCALEDRVKDFSDLVVGMVLNGKICNITAFGAFVDLGIKESGLVHVSQMCDRFVTSPSDVVKIGQVVSVRVIELDESRRRIALSMKNV